MLGRWIKRSAAGAAIALALAQWGCTLQDRYDSMRDNNMQECDRLVTEPQREECRANLPPPSFEEYERLRRTLPKPGTEGKL